MGNDTAKQDKTFSSKKDLAQPMSQSLAKDQSNSAAALKSRLAELFPDSLPHIDRCFETVRQLLQNANRGKK